MGLFRSNKVEPAPVSPTTTTTTTAAAPGTFARPADGQVVEEHRGLFGRKKTVSKRHSMPANASTTSPGTTLTSTNTSPIGTHHHNKHGSGLTNGDNASVTSDSRHVSRLNEINSVLPAAREKVRLAEEAEIAARVALKNAETAVIEARRHVKALEEEANEQARLAELAAREAKAKLAEVTALKKKTGQMGRI